jgi:hypothetical protein
VMGPRAATGAEAHSRAVAVPSAAAWVETCRFGMAEAAPAAGSFSVVGERDVPARTIVEGGHRDKGSVGAPTAAAGPDDGHGWGRRQGRGNGGRREKIGKR